jgi:hypothetical protein
MTTSRSTLPSRTARTRAHLGTKNEKAAKGPSRNAGAPSGPSADLIRAFVARGTRALARIAEHMPRERLIEAVGAETDTEALFRSLSSAAAVGAEIAPGAPDPLTAAYLRGAEMKRTMLKAEGGVLSAQQLAGHLGITPQGLAKKRERGQVFWLQIGEGYVYPAFQVGPKGLLPGTREVLNALDEDDPWARVNFMLTADARLGGRRPLDVLREGDVPSIVRAARGYGEHGA